MEEPKKQESIAPNELTIHWWAPSVYLMIHWNKA
jgi:hypothetical protein